MPVYFYKCDKCEGSFKTTHGMNDTLTECVVCHEAGCIKKVPSLLTSLPSNREKNEAGTRVKEAVEDAKELLLDSKKELSKKIL